MAQVTWSSSGFSVPAWAAEELTPTKLMPGGARLDPAQFLAADAQVITLIAGAIASGANRTLTLTAALKFDIPAGYILDFGAGEFCTLTRGATKGATQILGVTVASDLEGGESATFAGVSPRKPIDSGVLVGRTFAERDAGTGFGLATVASDEEIFLLAFGVDDANINPDCTLLRHGTLIYEDKLPNWATLTTQERTAIRARYQCIRSAG